MVGSDIAGICSVEIHYRLFSEPQIRILVVQYQIRILMVFVLVVVLEVVETMVVMVPGLHDDTLVVLSGGLEEFLDSWCDLLSQKDLEIPLVVHG